MMKQYCAAKETSNDISSRHSRWGGSGWHLPHLSALEDTADCSPHFIARTALTVLSLKNGRAVARERTTRFGT